MPCHTNWSIATKWASPWENVPNKNQLAHLHSLSRVFIVCMKKLCILGYPKCVQWRFWSACANAQADQNLRWVHIFEDFLFWLIYKDLCKKRALMLHVSYKGLCQPAPVHCLIRTFIPYLQNQWKPEYIDKQRDPGWADTQIALGLWCLHMISNAQKGPLCILGSTQALISFRTGWLGPSLSAYRINGYQSI